MQNGFNGGRKGSLQRYRKVIRVLIQYGFEDIVAHPPFNRLIPDSQRWSPKRDGKPITQYTRYERIRMVCEELGTTFIKFAQIASNRPDLFPEELVQEFIKLQDRVPAAPAEAIRSLIRSELGKDPEALFRSFDFEPIASASIAQVHRAVLPGDQEVVLKILRPGTVETVEADIQILKSIAAIVEQYFPSLRHFKAREYVQVFEKTIRKEMKFQIESGNVKRFSSAFAADPVVVCPVVFPEFSTPRILCMEYIDGYKINDFDGLARCGWNRKELAKKGIDLYFEQIFTHGFFHADPHPGNIFVLPGRKICFLDYGMMGIVTEADKDLFTEIILVLSRQDKQGLKKLLLRFSALNDPAQLAGLDYEIEAFFQEYSQLSIHEIDMEEVFSLIGRMFFEYKIQAPANLMLLGRALAIVEGVGLQLDPEYYILENIKPFGLKLLKERLSIRNIAKGLSAKALEWSRLATQLPGDLYEIVQKIKNDRLTIEFEHKGLHPVNQRLHSTAVRLSYSMIISALIVGASLVIHARIPPFVMGIPLLGFSGLIIAFLLGIRLALLK